MSKGEEEGEEEVQRRGLSKYCCEGRSVLETRSEMVYEDVQHRRLFKLCSAKRFVQKTRWVLETERVFVLYFEHNIMIFLLARKFALYNREK